jgi:hypothetical protein
MQRKSFIKLLAAGFCYMFMGNLLSAIMTISVIPIASAASGQKELVMGIAAVFAMMIYLLLVAVPAYMDGLAENTSRRRISFEKPADETVPKYRWAAVGAILWGVMLIPSVVFLLGGIGTGVYRMLSGAVYPLSLFLVSDNGGVRSLMSTAPYVVMGFYALTLPSCHIGFILGLGDRLSKDKIMYK